MKLPIERAVRVDGLLWKVIETRGRKSGPILVMLPGTLGTAAIFREPIERLGASVRMVSVTYPLIDDIQRLADSLAALMDKLVIPQASVVGSSLGGFLAQHFAARHPQRLNRLILGNTLCDPALTRPIVQRQTVEDLRAAPATKHRDMVLTSVRSWPETEPAVKRLKALLIDSGTRLLSPRAMKARVLAVQAAPAVPALAIPAARITIVDCEDDPLLPRAVQDDVVKRYPGAHHTRLKTGGHYPYIVRPDAYCALLERALGID